MKKKTQLFTSIGIILATLGFTYLPLSGSSTTVVIVSGTELQEPLQILEAQFEKENPNIQLQLQFQGSQDMVNNYLDGKNNFTATMLIPANGEILQELRDRVTAQTGNNPFYGTTTPIAKTILVGVAWQERGKVLFPKNRFDWGRVEKAMQGGTWDKIGGDKSWGSFDFVTTNPTRSNSGQLTLGLWIQSQQGELNSLKLNDPKTQSLFTLIKRSVYQPPRSTDILLQEFITRGPNDADVAVVYESVALNRWKQAEKTQGKAYQIYYLNPTLETTSTAVILQKDVDDQTAYAAQQFLDYITQPKQQEIFIQSGFRPVKNSLDLKTVPSSPWARNIPGVEVQVPGQIIPSPDPQVLTEIQRVWERSN